MAAGPQTFLLLFALCRFASCALTNAEGEPTGELEGTVFVMEQGHQICTSGAKVLASGPVNFEIATNADGRFAFVACLQETTRSKLALLVSRLYRRSLSVPMR